MTGLDNRPPAGSPERKKLSRIAELALDIVDLDPKNPSDQKKLNALLEENPEIAAELKNLIASK